MYTIIVQLLTGLSLLSPLPPKHAPGDMPRAEDVPKSNTTFPEFGHFEARLIHKTYLKATDDAATFDRLAADNYEQFSCWDYPGNVGCWIGDWLVSCEKNDNTGNEWDCGAAHSDDLD